MLYFVALIPPDELKAKIHAMKLRMKENYFSSHALNAPPHITLLSPFQTAEKNLNEVETILSSIASNTKPIEIRLDNLSSFDTRVLFIDVKKNTQIEQLQLQIEHSARRQPELFHYRYDDRPYHPHITLAFKDLSPNNFRKAWDAMKNTTIKDTFKAESMVLLKHNGKIWEAIKEYRFEL